MKTARGGHSRQKTIICAIGSAAAVTVALLLIYLVGGWIELGETIEARGDLAGRFEPKRTIECEGNTYQYRERLTTLLLIGVDTNTLNSGEVMGYRSGGQADFLLLLVMDGRRKTITPIQIDRDTMTEIAVTGVMGNRAGTQVAQICLAHGFGGGGVGSCLNTANAVSGLLLGVEIDYYVAMNLDSIVKFNDMLGGVEVTLEDDFSALDPEMIKGITLTLHGNQAEYYIRSRMNIGSGTNDARMRRQRTYMNGAAQILSEKLNTNVNFIGELYDALESDIETNMKRGRMINVAYACRDYAQNQVTLLPGSHSLGSDGFMGFYTDDEALKKMVTDVFYELLDGQ